MALRCQQMEESFLHAFVDGEFTADERAEVVTHLKDCAACAHVVRLHEGFRGAAARANIAAPHTLHDSVKLALVGAQAPGEDGRWLRAFREPRAIAVAAAAVGAAAWFLAGGLTHPLLARRSSLVEDGIALHARALPLDYVASDVASAQKWLAGRLDFGIRVPRIARLQGVRLSNVHSRPAAVVTYTVPGHDRRVSLLIVDDPDPLLSGEARKVRDREVWLSRAKGFNIASWRNDEIVYSLISDLEEKDVLALVQAADER